MEAQANPRSVRWCNWEGNPVSWAGPLPSIEMVSRGLVSASPTLRFPALRFPALDSFVAGNLRSCSPFWEVVLKGHPKASEILGYITEGLEWRSFFAPFRGSFKGHSYHSDSPPPGISFPNSPSCARFLDFVTRTILERVSNGSLLVWGEVCKEHPPHLVMPITVGPGKPRMCHDERFLNLWIRDFPFKLDSITDLPRFFAPGHFQTTFDDKSGYDHVRLHPSSSTFFGLQWRGSFFVFATLPFCWKASTFLCQTIGLAATNYVRSSGVPCALYIDDRHLGQLRLPLHPLSSSFSAFQLAEMAAYIACSASISLGYFIALSKSSLLPATALTFLGYVCDSVRLAFLLPPDKRAKFSALRESILEHKTVSLKNLHKFAGKTTSFALLVPSPAPLPRPPCSFALPPNLGKNFCIGGFSILGVPPLEERVPYSASHVFGCFPLRLEWLPCHPGSVPFGSPRPLGCGVPRPAYCSKGIFGSSSRPGEPSG